MSFSIHDMKWINFELKNSYDLIGEIPIALLLAWQHRPHWWEWTSNWWSWPKWGQSFNYQKKWHF